ncbi:MAG: DHH family phosphoesterase [Candidatus Choladocola sp.]|nr:DHH family phosphoesterase [Candidatus Choladocola sp.]
MRGNKAGNKAQIKYSGKLMRHWYWCGVLTLFLLALTAVILYIDTLAGCIVGGFTVVIYLTVLGLDMYYKPRVLLELMDFAQRFSGIEKEMLKEFVIPYGLAQPDGKMIWMNDMMMSITGKSEEYHKNISTLFPELSSSNFPVGAEERTVEIEHEEKKYRVSMKKIVLEDILDDADSVEKVTGECYVIGIHFFDITELTAFKKENYDQKPVVGLLYMDNYDEVMDSVEDMRRSMLEALVDRRITKYVSSLGGLIKKMEKDKYLLVVNRKCLEVMEADRFSILEDVKTVNIGNTIGVTVSIGIGTNSGDYAQNYDSARVAIEMALARGGDQAVVKDHDKMAFFGGKTQRSEKNTRVRARVKAQALRELISTRERVIVMGHKITDIDSLGASVGVCRAAMQVGKPAHIVLGDINSGIRPWVNVLEANDAQGEKLFLTHEQAVEMTNQNTVVVVVDTNRPSMTECEELLYLTRTIVVLDHHRQATEKIENAALSYIESSASSACEMISEILQYYDDSIKLKPCEADCIYAGIIVDTNNFVAKTGMRTFEAAAFLRRNGADMTRVRKAFRNDMETYKARAEAVRHAEAFMGCYAISTCPSQGLESPTVVGAQAANELLNIIGVKASFVLTDYNNKIYISARAIDEVNVQIIMERLGGGGHMNIAGAQLEGVDAEEARVRLKEVLTQMTKEGAI